MSRYFLSLLLCANALAAFDSSHSAWDKILKSHVKVIGATSQVNYPAIKSAPRDLEAYLTSLSAVDEATFDKWGEKDRLAFLINAYNAFTVKLIVDNYPVKSIKDLGGLLSTPWKKTFFKLLGKDFNLDNIEHDRIRAKFDEPRIHFAVVCASKGCPSLRNEAYLGSRLEEQLESNTRGFLKDAERNHFDAKENKLYLSKLFDWYRGDFEKAAGSVPKFVAPRMGSTLDAKVSFNDYDWSLNGLAPSAASVK